MRVRLWAREDGEQPKSIGLTATKGPGPGKVYDVQARTANEARAILAAFFCAEPDELRDPDSWIAWRAARRAVREVTS